MQINVQFRSRSLTTASLGSEKKRDGMIKMHNLRSDYYRDCLQRSGQSTSRSAVPWGQFQQRAVRILRLTGGREGGGHPDSGERDIGGTRGGERAVWRGQLVGTVTRGQRRKLTERAGQGAMQAPSPPSLEPAAVPL